MRLITIGFSHYCEKARWALDRMSAEYTEDAHAPLAHWPTTLRASGQRTVPVLVTEDGVFSDSTDILKYVDPFLPDDARLFPEDADLRREVCEVEEMCDREIGPRVRRWVYAWLIDDPVLPTMIEATMTPAERRVSPLITPMIVKMIGRGLKISPSLRESQFEKIKAAFFALSDRLRDRKFLVGDSFSAADLALAALSGPALFVENHPVKNPPFGDLPAGMRRQIEELRATPAGAHVVAMYASERKRAYPRKP